MTIREVFARAVALGILTTEGEETDSRRPDGGSFYTDLQSKIKDRQIERNRKSN